MNYKLNKSAIDRVLRQANAEPEELLEWFEWAVKLKHSESEELLDMPCSKKPFMGKYIFYDDEYIEWRESNFYNTDFCLNFKDISKDFTKWLEFLWHCRTDKRYYQELIAEYKQRYNLT